GSNTCFAERHQDFSIRAEFENLLTLSILILGIRHPKVSFAVNRHSVWLHEHVRAEALQEFARRVELQNGGIAPMKHPDIALRVRVGRDHRTEFHSCGKLRPTFSKPVWIVLPKQDSRGQYSHSDQQHS